MLIKVCGLREPANYTQIAHLQNAPDFFGSILYAQSPRHVTPENMAEVRSIVAPHQKVLVVVDASIPDILQYCLEYSYGIVQLHGPQYTKEQAIQLIDNGIEVWKVFSIKHDIPKEVNSWHGFADMFLFDTQTPQHGGSGEKFDWSVLSAYKGPTAFFLSGGIQPSDAERLSHYKHEFCVGFDINSKFEETPGYKETGKIQEFVATIHSK